MSIRIIMDPVRDPSVTTHARIIGVRVRLSNLGPGSGGASVGTSTPARLTFLAAPISSARPDAERNFQPFATMSGTVTLEGKAEVPVFFNANDTAGFPELIAYTEDPAGEDPAVPRQRLELDFDPTHFRNMLEPDQTNAVMLLPPRVTSSHDFWEVGMSLEVAGDIEAPREVNDVLDVDAVLSLPRVVVLDPGHGGTTSVGGSSPNNATSPSGVLEKAMTLDMAQRVQAALVNKPRAPRLVLTRSADVNLGLEARANVARDHSAQLFLSIHFNGTNGVARGVETLISPAAQNVNIDEDRAFAQRIQDAVFGVIQRHDPGTSDRGVREQNLGTLRDDRLGNTAANHPCRACLAEIEFIDVPAVDQLLNTNANAATVKDEIADAIANAIMDEIGL